jgi:hypothetical protein
MRKFKDRLDREWALNLTLASEGRVHAETQVYLSDVDTEGGGSLARIASDSAFLGMAVWTLCASQAEALGLSQEEFLDGFDGATVDASRDALIEETLDFLGRRGQAIRAEKAETRRLAEEIEAENLAAMKGLSGVEVLRILDRLLARFTVMAGNAAASAGSTPES